MTNALTEQQKVIEKIMAENEQLRAENALARERLGPAGWKVLEDHRRLTKAFDDIQKAYAQPSTEHTQLRLDNESLRHAFRKSEDKMKELGNEYAIVCHFKQQLEESHAREAVLVEGLQKIATDKWAMNYEMKNYDCSVAYIAERCLTNTSEQAKALLLIVDEAKMLVTDTGGHPQNNWFALVRAIDAYDDMRSGND